MDFEIILADSSCLCDLNLNGWRWLIADFKRRCQGNDEDEEDEDGCGDDDNPAGDAHARE